MDKIKIQEIVKQAEKESSRDDINDEDKYLVDQKIDTLKALN